MDDAAAALLYRSDLRSVLQGMFALVAIFGFYLRLESKRAQKASDLFRRTLRRYRSARRALRSKSRQVEVMANRLDVAHRRVGVLEAEIREMQLEAKRMLAIRVKSERGVRTKHDELQDALAEAIRLRRLIDHVDPTA